MSKHWQPSGKRELKRLATSEGFYDATDVSVASSISFHSSPSPVFVATRSKKVRIEFAANLPAASPCGSRLTSSQSTDFSALVPAKSPPSHRVIMERGTLISLMESHMFCPTCKSAVVVSFPTVGIASGCRIQCQNDLCSYVHVELPTKGTSHE